MPQTTITAEQDEALEAICPHYLGGERNVKLRVAWAIERALLADADKKDAQEAQRMAEDMKMRAWKEGRK